MDSLKYIRQHLIIIPTQFRVNTNCGAKINKRKKQKRKQERIEAAGSLKKFCCGSGFGYFWQVQFGSVQQKIDRTLAKLVRCHQHLAAMICLLKGTKWFSLRATVFLVSKLK